MKSCFKCGVSKPYTDFYKHSGTIDGHLGKCKECTKSDTRRHRRDNDSVREYDRKRGNRKPPDASRKYREANPKKYAAHIWIGNAVRDGKLVKPDFCSECESQLQIEGHHDDYDKITEVRWLCSRCHSIWHALHGEALNPF